MFGDNQSVVTSSTIPHSSLSKRWNALSYHRVYEAIAGGWLRFEHIPGTENPADILTKILPWYKLRVFVKPMLLWKGDTVDAPAVTQSTEGSDVSPSPGVTSDIITNGDAGAGTNARSETTSIPIFLRDNYFAVLVDDSTDATQSYEEQTTELFERG